MTGSDQGGVFLTGATGFLGMSLLARYLERTDRHVYALVRAPDDTAARARMDEALRGLCGPGHAYAGRVTALAGDVTLPGLGLDADAAGYVAGDVDEVIHTAASVSFDLPLAESRFINVGGTENALDFADLCHERGGIVRFAHVSTAYVAGTTRGTFRETEVDCGQQFRNPYEQSKLEAERAVRARASRLPIQVMRPSIIVGETTSGWTSSFNVVYWPLRAFSAGLYDVVPGRRSSPVDVVPIDYVADAILALRPPLGQPGRTYQLVAADQASSVGELVALATKYFDRPAPLMLPPAVFALVRPLLAWRAGAGRRVALEQSDAYFPHFSLRTRFAADQARAVLEPAGISCPPLARYFDRVLGFAVASRWGRRTIGRAEAHRAGADPIPGGRVQVR